MLARRLPIVSVDPFKDWSITQNKPNQTSPNEATSTVALKRPMVSTIKESASTSGASNAKEMRTVSYYATMLDLSKGVAIPDPEDSEMTRPHLQCQVVLFNGLRVLIYPLIFTFTSFSIRNAKQ